MAQKRQGLAQRRKAVGLTQEALAHRLGVERSTIVRWEAGDTEPLPAIRPDVARALEVSIDQLAELLTEPGTADPAHALPACTEVTMPALLPEVQPVLLPAERPGRARSRWFTPFAAAGVLTLVLTGGALSVQFIAAHSDPISPAGQAPAVPAAALPVPSPGSNPGSNPGNNTVTGPGSEDPTEAIPPAPATAPGTPADGPVSPGVAPVPAPLTIPMAAPHTIRSGNRATSLRKYPAAARTPAPPRTPAIPPEAYAWAQAAGLSASDLRRARFRP